MTGSRLRARTRHTALATLVTLVLTAGCTSADDPEVGLQATSELTVLTTQLIGTADQPDEQALEAVFIEMDRSVTDMGTLGVADFRRAHGRGPSDQATLIGRWLGQAAATVSGPVVGDQVRAAAAGPPLSLPVRSDQSAADLLDAVTAELAARTPNETTDNPSNPAADNLRSALQLGYTSARD